MTFDQFIRLIVRSKPILESAALAFFACIGGIVFLVRSVENQSTDGQSIDTFIACLLFAAVAYFGFRATWLALRHWADSHPPVLPPHKHRLGESGFEDPEEAARRMRGGKL